MCHPDFWWPEPLGIKMGPLLPPARGKQGNESTKFPLLMGKDSNFFFKGEFCTIPTHFCFKPKSKILTLNCEGVSRMLKSEDAEIPSSRVSRNTFWNSSISGKLPKSDSIYMKAGIGKRVSAVKTQRPLLTPRDTDKSQVVHQEGESSKSFKEGSIFTPWHSLYTEFLQLWV